MAETIRITGLKECRAAFRKLSGDLDKTVRAALREAAVPVRDEARQIEAAKWQGASVGTIGIAVRARGVAVTQRARKVTGKRGDYGRLQQKDAFDKALDDKQDIVVTKVEHVLDTIIDLDIA